MKNDSYTALFTRIGDVCQRYRWYGPDVSIPSYYSSFGYDAKGNELLTNHGIIDMREARFAYPPATEAQLLATEDKLGFPLPPALRALYAHIANGGFGPAFGIIGAIGGFPSKVDFHCDDITDGYHTDRGVDHIDIGQFESAFVAHERVLLPQYVWPDYLLPLCYYGCGMVLYIHALKGSILLFDPVLEGCIMTREASSLEEWLLHWIKDRERKAARYSGS